MENKQGYDPSEFEDDDYTTPQPDAGKSIRGYRIVIIILSVILAALSVLYFSIHRQQMLDNELLQADRDSIQNDLGRLMTDYDGLRISNDSISAGLTLERERADSLMTRLKKERSWNLAKIKQYEKEVGTLRTIMKGYVKQIDSLNTLNKKLIKENVGFRKEISSAKLRADMAEEKAAELDNKVKVGSVLRARDIRLSALNDRSKPVSRVKNAARLRVDFVLAANELATPGNKAGGLSTLDEKSLGCIRKGGTRPVVEVVEQAARPTKRGAIIMDTAGYDISSVTSMVAGGCQAIVFTTGRGTPYSTAAPTIKVSTNTPLYEKKRGWMDFIRRNWHRS